MISELNKLHDEGILKKLFKAGLISYKIFFYREVYLYYDALIKTGKSAADAHRITADKLDIDLSTVYKIIKRIA